MEGGDPNIINKVFSEILKKRDVTTAIQMASIMPDGLRHLRNFAKKRRDDSLLTEIAAFSLAKPGEKPNDFSAVLAPIQAAYEAETVTNRVDNLRSAVAKMDKLYKDEFYTKVILEMIEVVER